MSHKTKEQHNEYQKAWRKRNPDKYQDALRRRLEYQREYSRSMRGRYAKYKNRGYNGSFADFESIVTSPCEYCGSTSIPFGGIDRVDSTLGYDHPGNIVPCCAVCNSMKSNRTTQEFLDQVDKIYKHRRVQ